RSGRARRRSSHRLLCPCAPRHGARSVDGSSVRIGQRYCKLMVAPFWLLADPTVRTTGTAPVPAFGGTIASTWRIPEICPGAEPAYVTCAGSPPMVSVTGNCGVRKRLPVTVPSGPVGLVAPSLVAISTTTWPMLDGLLLEFKLPS